MPLSAAMQRFNGPDKDNPWFAKFKYSQAQGLGYEKGVVRRDCSSVNRGRRQVLRMVHPRQASCPPVGFAADDR